jgi:alkanesulfonate monooxygenase SsuD/methylene tetrahydromethanopterin reductase-like flavin-dependent oxidoreductase (luciferase family)
VKIGIGLPNPVPGTPGGVLLDWARRAEERGFSALATIDRIAYPSYDSLATLTAAGAATSRIGLTTNILIAPLYHPVLLAKRTASIDQLTGGRLTLGLAPGGRPDDYDMLGRDFHSRGRDFDAQLELLHRVWRGEPVGGVERRVCPPPVNGDRVPILVGGSSDAAIRRVTTWGAGWTVGGVAAEMAAPMVERVRTAWKDAGRAGEPRLAALAYYSLGTDAEEDSMAYLRDYYAFLGPYADQIASGALRSESAIRAAVTAFEEIGITELYLDPTATGLDQVDRLADLLL